MLACATSAASFNAWRTRDDLSLLWNEALRLKAQHTASHTCETVSPWNGTLAMQDSSASFPKIMTCSNIIIRHDQKAVSRNLRAHKKQCQTNKPTNKQTNTPTKQTNPYYTIMWKACLFSLWYELNCSHCMLMELETPASAGAGWLSGGALGGSCRTVQMHTLNIFETNRNVVKKPCRTWYQYNIHRSM